MPTPTSAVKVNPLTGALIDPPVATFASANGLLTGGSSDAKDSVRVATTANGTLATAFANGQTVDGIALVTGNRILLKNQTAPAENGIYTVNASGAPTRATDFDAWTEIVGAFTNVEAGAVNAGTQWLCNVVSGGTIGTTAITFVVPKNFVDLTTNQTVGGNKYFGPNGTFGGVQLSKDGLVSAVGGQMQFLEDDSVVIVSANSGYLWVHTTGDTDVTFPTSGTLLSTANLGANVGTWLATPSGANLASALTSALPVSKGGTGLTAGTSGGILAFTASGTIASSGALAANAIVVGGGAGVAPSTTTTGAGVLVANINRPIFVTTATAAGTTTLTVTSEVTQEFTGTTTQTVTMPVVTTLVAGWATTFINKSTGNVTLNSSGGNAIGILIGGQSVTLVCKSISADTTAAAWDYVGQQKLVTVQKSANQSPITDGVDTLVTFNTIVDGFVQSCWNTGTSTFTAPETRIYNFRGNIRADMSAAGNTGNIFNFSYKIGAAAAVVFCSAVGGVSVLGTGGAMLSFDLDLSLTAANAVTFYFNYDDGLGGAGSIKNTGTQLTISKA